MGAVQGNHVVPRLDRAAGALAEGVDGCRDLFDGQLVKLVAAHHRRRAVRRADRLQTGPMRVAVAPAMVDFRGRSAAMRLHRFDQTSVSRNVLVGPEAELKEVSAPARIDIGRLEIDQADAAPGAFRVVVDVSPGGIAQPVAPVLLHRRQGDSVLHLERADLSGRCNGFVGHSFSPLHGRYRPVANRFAGLHSCEREKGAPGARLSPP